MLNLKKIEQELVEIETKIENANFIEQKDLIRRCNHRINVLNKSKRKMKQQQELEALNTAIYKIKKVKRLIKEEIRKKEAESRAEINYEKQRKENRLEEQELATIMNSEEEKEKKDNNWKNLET